jgi:hypothetical protein
VSFYGDGYVQVPLRRDLATTAEDADLELHFRSTRTDAILLLIAGPSDDSDYCLVTLDRGAVVVRSYLGSGETTLRAAVAPPPPRRATDGSVYAAGATFADFEWHFINVTWSRGRVLLAVDRVYTDSKPVRGRHSELNVVNGNALVGIGTGTPHDATAFLFAGRDFLPFRGCMHHVTFKGYDVFEIARNPPPPDFATSSSGVTWGSCSPEFTASVDQPISFVGNSSYALFEAPFDLTTTMTSTMTTSMSRARVTVTGNQTRTLLSFDIRTRSSNAIVLYGGAGPVARSRHSSFQTAVVVDDEDDDGDVTDPNSSLFSFLLMELIEGRLILRIVGDRSVLLTSPLAVDDGSWHQIVVAVRHRSPNVDDADTSITLSVDSRTVEERADALTGQHPIWRRSSQIFLGGVDARSRPGLLRRRLEYLVGPQVLTSVDSLNGCIRNLIVNGGATGEVRLLGFPDIIASRGLRVGCIWTFPCGQPDRCPASTECVEDGFDGYRCRCRVANCTSPLSPLTTCGPVRLRALVVYEGGRATITTEHLDLTAADRLGLGRDESHAVTAAAAAADSPGESPVTFVVRSPATSGVLFVQRSTASPSAGVVSFTLTDLRLGRVLYIHDGSERPADQFSIELLSAGNGSVPVKSGPSHTCTLPIQVIAVNDRPFLRLPDKDSLFVVADSQLTITDQVINAIDADDPPSRLTIIVDYLMDGSDKDHTASASHGYFEMTSLLSSGTAVQRRPTRVDRFTQADINAERVTFVHRGSAGSEQYFRLRVSDEKDSSDARILRVLSSVLELLPVKFTGLAVSRFASQAITSHNLTFVVGSADGNIRLPEVDVRYEITERPRDGEIQQLLSGPIDDATSQQSWKTVTSFTQRQIDGGMIRYAHLGQQKHLQTAPQSTAQPLRADRFRVRASVAPWAVRGVSGRPELEFRIDVVDCRAELVRSTGLRLRDGNREGRVTSNELRASGVAGASSESLLYHVISTPRQGNLLLMTPVAAANVVEADGGLKRRVTLAAGMNFTQRDVDDGRLVFRFHKLLFSPIVDDFEFKLIGPSIGGHHCTWQSDVALFEFRYEPLPQSDAAHEDPVLVNNGLRSVLEGDQATVTADDLFVVKRSRDLGSGTVVVNFFFSVVTGPRHGRLMLFNPETRRVINFNTTSFGTDDVSMGRVIYVHDDTETDTDSFSFTVTSAASQSGNMTLFSGIFDIDVILRNDNPPIRVVNRVIDLLSGRGRTLTIDDLEYNDPDVNYDSSNLVYSWIPTVAAAAAAPHVVLASNRSVVLQRFRQRDLADGSLYVQQPKGSRRSSTINISVTDGYFNTSDVVRFTVVEPFLRILSNRSDVKVRWNSTAMLTPDNFAVDTNLEKQDATYGIQYTVVELPRHGYIRINNTDNSLPQFLLYDLEQGFVTYCHNGGNSSLDGFHFVARIDDLTATGYASIIIEPHSVTDDFFTESMTTTEPEAVVTTVISPTVNIGSATVEELQSVVLTNASLEISQPEVSPSKIVYSVVLEPRHGTLILDGASSISDTTGRAFTQSDVNKGAVKYRHSEVISGNPRAVIKDGIVSDAIRFNASVDGKTLLTDVEFVVKVLPTEVQLEVGNLTVTEGGHIVIGADTLRVSGSITDVTFTVLREPLYGRIQTRDKISPTGSSTVGGESQESSSRRGPSLRRFSLERLRQGVVLYAHDGSDHTRDNFTVVAQRLRRPQTRSVARVVQVTVIGINDQPPRMTINEKMDVWMGMNTYVINARMSCAFKLTCQT